MSPIMLRALAGLAVLIGFGWLQPGQAAELLPPDRPLPEVIDHYIDAKLKQADVQPVPPADDATLVRRLSLDLIGRIPSPAEAQTYVEAKDPGKRAELVSCLLASPEYVRHAATEFDVLLRGVDNTGPTLRPYLLAALAEDRPWDQMFRELLGVQAAPLQPEQFVLQRIKDPDMLTRDVSSTFFGLNITCAQCHKHPYVGTLTQDYFFGLKAFFAGPKLSYKNKAGAQREVGLMFLTGATIEAPAADTPIVLPVAKGAKPAPPIITFRGQLSEISLRPENRDMFARSIVNRLWFRFLGHGLVNRVDQMHAANPPTHPELLAWLTRDLIEHNYDLRRLVQGIVSSQTYARGSRWDRATPPPPELFAVANLRPLTPMQYGLSQLLAGNAETVRTDVASEVLTRQRDELEEVVRKRYGALIEQPQLDSLQINVNEALRLSNDPAILNALGAGLARKVVALSDHRQQIEAAVWTVHSRPPTEQEQRTLGDFLTRRPRDGTAVPSAEKVLQRMIWALLTSAEFRFNH